MTTIALVSVVLMPPPILLAVATAVKGVLVTVVSGLVAIRITVAVIILGSRKRYTVSHLNWIRSRVPNISA